MNDLFRCDCCGKFIAARDFDYGAVRRLLTPDSHYSKEDYETICIRCNEHPRNIEL